MLKKVLLHFMQSERVLTLRGRYNYLSQYRKIEIRKQIKEDLVLLTNQYKWIEDIGIYIPELNLWITVLEYDDENKGVSITKKEKTYTEIIDGSIYLKIIYKNKGEYLQGYIKLTDNEIVGLIDKMKFDENTYIEMLVNEQILRKDKPQCDNNYKDYDLIYIKSKLYPIEVNIYRNNGMINLGQYL